MQLNRCPVCHSRIGLEQLAQDEAASELLALLAKLPNSLALPLVVYIGLFRSAKRDLANDRALRLVQETLALHGDHGVLAAALGETVEAMRKKQEQGAFKPLSNDRYLRSVLESVAARGQAMTVVPGDDRTPVRAPSSRTALAMQALQEDREL
ncbi:MAG: hypothetical protein M0Q49_02085 [Porticoccaceae bacterium]|nr:hypothetical protein [Porticoccaceae bacterium]